MVETLTVTARLPSPHDPTTPPLHSGMEKSGGEALVVNEDAIAKANAYAKAQLKVNSCITGSVGLSGLMTRGATHATKPSIVVLSGIDRASKRAFSTR